MNINNQIIIFTASRLTKKNGLKYLIKAMKYLPENYALRIAGSGELEKKLQRLADRMDINHRFALLGFLNKGGLEYYYKMADVVCRPSLSEGLGNVFLEGLGHHRPCVAPNIMGITTIFNDFPEAMFDCGVKNPKKVAEQIELALKTEIDWEKVQDRLAEKYDWDVIAGQMGNIFSNLISNELTKGIAIIPNGTK